MCVCVCMLIDFTCVPQDPILRDSRLTQALVKLSLWIKHCTDLCGAAVMQATECVSMCKYV